MRFISLLVGGFMLIAFAGCATNPYLNGMRYDIDMYRGNEMLAGGGEPQPLSYVTGMRSNIDRYRSLDLLPNEEDPSVYNILTGMRRNVDAYRGLRLGNGEVNEEEEIMEMENNLEQ